MADDISSREFCERLPNWTQDQAAAAYAQLIRYDDIDWRMVNQSILERWSQSGLESVKRKAWDFAQEFCATCDGRRVIYTGECREAMSGPTCMNPDCPPCQTPETEPCPDCQPLKRINFNVEVSMGVVVNARRMGGKPTIRGTRLSAEHIANLVSGESPMSPVDIIENWPFLTYYDIANVRYWDRRGRPG